MKKWLILAIFFFVISCTPKEVEFQELRQGTFSISFPQLLYEEKSYTEDNHFYLYLTNRKDCDITIRTRTDNPLGSFFYYITREPRASVILSRVNGTDADFLYDYYESDTHKYMIIRAMHKFCNDRFYSVEAKCKYKGFKNFKSILDKMFDSMHC